MIAQGTSGESLGELFLSRRFSAQVGKSKRTGTVENVLPDRMIVTIGEFDVMVNCPKCHRQVARDEIDYDCMYCNRRLHCRNCPNCGEERFVH